MHRLSPSAVERICAGSAVDGAALFPATAGNPFYVTEALAAPDDDVPPTVVDAVLARARGLGPASQAALGWEPAPPHGSSGRGCVISAAPGCRGGRRRDPVEPGRSHRPAARRARPACRGFTNAEIGERLVVSTRTVDHHVSAILAKLGVTSRQEAARAASELELLRI
ncbi:MAG: response regulator transcription factor [Frankiaceae bacterium]